MIKKQAVKTILFLTILFFGLFLFVNFARAQEATPEGRALEIVYPQIPGVATPKVISTGLPEYIEYIFRFSIWIIGFVILGALIYAGFQYFTSFGNPEKLSAAKNGITSAIVGAIILLSAVLIFNTINPQLVILEAPPLSVVEPTVFPGIYVCNYDVSEVLPAGTVIGKIIDEYANMDQDIEKRKERRLEAAKKLKEIMLNKEGTCGIIRFSQNFKNPFEPQAEKGWLSKSALQSNQTIFAIPEEKFIYNLESKKTEPKWVYEYGVIFHEKNNFQGKCKLIDHPYGLYDKITPYPLLGDFKQAKSVTLFKIPDYEPIPGNRGVILYQCLDYNKGGFCPPGVEGVGKDGFFSTDNNIGKVTRGGLGDLVITMKTKKVQTTEEVPTKPGTWAPSHKTVYININVPISKEEEVKGARSIKIDPEGSFFAVLFSGDNFTGDKCEVINADDPNFLDNPIGQCGDTCQFASPAQEQDKNYLNKNCYPCLQSMIIVKGKVIK